MMVIVFIMSHDDHDNNCDNDDNVQERAGGGFWQLHLPRNKPTWASQVEIVIVIIIIIVITITNIIILIINHHEPDHPPQARDSGVWEAFASCVPLR